MGGKEIMQIIKLTSFLIIIFSISLFGQKSNVSNIFQKFGVTGCFAMYDVNNDSLFTINHERCDSQFIPASTYKIMNSLIALETKNVQNENEVFKWDGVEREVLDWNKDLTLSEAVKVSAVWVFKEIAKRIGTEKSRDYVQKCQYGNCIVDDNSNSYWLDGSIRISALQQVDFLQQMCSFNLPFSDNTIKTFEKIIIQR